MVQAAAKQTMIPEDPSGTWTSKCQASRGQRGLISPFAKHHASYSAQLRLTSERRLRSASDPDTELHSRCIHGWSRGVGAPREDTVNRTCGETITMWGGTGRECQGLAGSEHFLPLTPVMLKLRALEEQGNNTEVAELLTMMLVLLGNADRVKGPHLCSQRW